MGYVGKCCSRPAHHQQLLVVLLSPKSCLRCALPVTAVGGAPHTERRGTTGTSTQCPEEKQAFSAPGPCHCHASATLWCWTSPWQSGPHKRGPPLALAHCFGRSLTARYVRSSIDIVSSEHYGQQFGRGIQVASPVLTCFQASMARNSEYIAGINIFWRS